MEDFTQCEVQQRERMTVLNYSKVPLQGSCSQVQCPRRVWHADLFAILRFTIPEVGESAAAMTAG